MRCVWQADLLACSEIRLISSRHCGVISGYRQFLPRAGVRAHLFGRLVDKRGPATIALRRFDKGSDTLELIDPRAFDRHSGAPVPLLFLGRTSPVAPHRSTACG